MATEKSGSELYFEWWLEELKQVGIVIEYEREPRNFLLKDALPIFYEQKNNKRSIIKSFNLFRPITYTPDYRVLFDARAKNILFAVIDSFEPKLLDSDFEENGSVYQQVSMYVRQEHMIQLDEKLFAYELWFDVKPPAVAAQFSGALASSRDFKYVSRMMYERHGILINKVVPIGQKTSLFAKTFLPRRYRYTDKSGALRKLKDYEEKALSIQQYLKLKKLI